MGDQNNNISPIEIIPFEPLDQQSKNNHKSIPYQTIGISLFFILCLVFVGFTILARAVIFEVEPREAKLKLHSVFSFNIGDNYLLMPGEHKISANAVGYLLLSQSVTVSDEKNQVIPLKLSPIPGIITFNSDIDNVSVSIGSEEVGKTGKKITGLPLGKQSFEFKKARYLDQVRELEVEGYGAEQVVDVALDPAWGIRKIQSKPTGATVILDGTEVGKTPLDVEILQSGTEVVLKAKDFEPWKKTLRADPGTEMSLAPVILEKVYASFAITSAPLGANVTLNGDFKGKTPINISAPSEQTHTIRIFNEGYETVNEKIRGASGSSVSKNYQLKPIFGRVSLNISPKDADVFINGKRYNGDRSSVRLAAKPQDLLVSKTGYVEQRRRFTPKQSGTQIIDVNLLTPTETRYAKIPKSYRSEGDISLQLLRPNSTFTMGAPRREPGRRANETERRVKINRPFYVSRHEITNKQYRQFDQAHNSKQVAGQSLDLPEAPVVYVSWEDAARFCNWLSSKEGLSLFYIEQDGKISGENPESDGYRLPTELEWAWMARVQNNPDAARYIWGDSFPPDRVVANFNDVSASKFLGSPIPNYNDKFPVSAPVGSFPANSLGIHDLGGNVSEWVNDYYEVGTTHRGDPLENPTGPETGETRIIRGASWKTSGRSELRLSFRDFDTAGREDLGFRVARSVNIE